MAKTKKPFPTDSVPRTQQEINAHYTELAAKAGAIQHQNYVNNKSLEAINQAILNLSAEATKRAELDKATAKAREDQTMAETKAVNAMQKLEAENAQTAVTNV